MRKVLLSAMIAFAAITSIFSAQATEDPSTFDQRFPAQYSIVEIEGLSSFTDALRVGKMLLHLSEITDGLGYKTPGMKCLVRATGEEIPCEEFLKSAKRAYWEKMLYFTAVAMIDWPHILSGSAKPSSDDVFAVPTAPQLLRAPFVGSCFGGTTMIFCPSNVPAVVGNEK